MAFHSADADVQLDAGRRVLAGSHRELKTRAVGNARRQRHPELMRKEFRPGPGASRAWLRPTLAAAPTTGARAPDRNFERQRGALDRFAWGHVDGGAQR